VVNMETAMDGGLTAALEEKVLEKGEETTAEAMMAVESQAAAAPNAKWDIKSQLAKLASWVAKFSVKFKILVSLWQILQGIVAAFSIPFPPFYEQAVSAVSGVIQIELPAVMPLDCIIASSYYSKLAFKCIWPLIAYAVLGISSKSLRKCGKADQADSCINLGFLIMFVIYPSVSSGLLSMFYCVGLEDGTEWLRVDLSLECSTATHSAMLAFTFVMLGLHTVGTPLIYSYLFFWKHHSALEALKEQELSDYHRQKVEEAKTYIKNEKVVFADPDVPKKPRIEAEEVLPGYMLKLTDGYEYRTYSFELVETIRKVLLVGVPSTFPERGGTAQLFWGLLVCFVTFGAYMMYAPFIEDSDDKLSQLAQLQIFLTLLSSLALRAAPPSEMVGQLVTVILFLVPLIGVALETPLLEELGQAFDVFRGAFVKLFPNLKPPTFEGSTTDVPAPALPPATKETKMPTETSTAASVMTEPLAAGEIAISVSPIGSPIPARANLSA